MDLSIFSSELTLYILYGVYAALNIMDGVSTWLVLRPDHFEREANPIARRIFIWLGIPRGIIITETVVLAILSPLIFVLAASQLEIAVVLLMAANLVFLWVVSDNLRIAFRYRKQALERKAAPPKTSSAQDET